MKKVFVIAIGLFVCGALKAQTLENGIDQLQKENYIKAKKELKQVYNNTKNSDAAFYLGNAYLFLGNNDSAKMYYTYASSGTTALSFIAQARLGLMNGGSDEAAKVLIEKAISMTKRKDAEVMFQAGRLAYRPAPTNIEFYMQYVKDAKEREPSKTYYALILGDMFNDLNKGGDAMNTYEAVTSVDPNNALANIKIGRLWYAAKNYELAIEHLEKANAADPNYSSIHKDLGELYYLTKNYAKSTEEFKKYIAANDNDTEIKLKYCSFIFSLKEHQKVLNEVSEFAKSDSTNYKYYRFLAFSSYELKKNAEARNYMNKVMTLSNPTSLNGLDYTYAAKIAAANNDTTNVISYFKKALEIDSTNADVYSEYGVLLFNYKRYADAVNVLKKRLALGKPKSLDYFYIGNSYYNCKDYVNSDTSFGDFLRMQPKSPDGYYWKASSLVQLDDPKAPKGLASPYYTKFIELGGSDLGRYRYKLVNAYSYLGFMALQNKDNANAKMYFTKALELDPEDKAVKAQLSKIK